MRTLIFVIAMILAGAAFGQARCSDSHRFGQMLVRVGDSERRVLSYREPDRQVQLENRQGAAVGYRLDFYEYQQTVQVYIQGGVVSRICRVRD